MWQNCFIGNNFPQMKKDLGDYKMSWSQRGKDIGLIKSKRPENESVSAKV